MMATTSGFVWYELMTNDLDEAIAFYGNVVRWDIRNSGMPQMRYELFGRDGKDVGGMMNWASIGEQGMPTAWMAHIHAADVDAETAAVVADGGTQVKAPRDIPGVGRFSVVADPQGATYLLFQPLPSEGAPPRLRPDEPGGVGWHELATTDWQAAWAFYSNRYGWTADMTVDMGPMGTYQTFRTDAIHAGGMMTMPSFLRDKGVQPGWLFYFVVDDIQAAAARVAAGGGTVTHGPAQVPGGAWIVQGTDPQGGAFGLTAAK